MPDPIDYTTDSPQQQNPIEALQAAASTPQPAPEDPTEKLRALLQTQAQETPEDILLRKLKMTKEDKAARSKLGNAGQGAFNIFQALAGRNVKNEANSDYQLQTQRMNQGSEILRNQESARKTDETLAAKDRVTEMLAQSKAAHEKTLADIAQGKKDVDLQKVEALKQKNSIADAWNKARTGTAADKQAAIDKFNEYKMSHPDERPESFIADALIAKSPSGQLDIAEYQKALDAFYKGKSLEKGPIIKTSNVPILNDKGDQIGTDVKPIIINRQTGEVGQPSGSSSGAGSPAGSTIPLGPQGNGSIAGTPQMVREAAPIKTALDGANVAAQNLLGDLGSGKIEDYSGWLRGSDALRWAREQGYAGDMSSGEAVEQFFAPTNVITHIRSMSPRLNEREIQEFGKAIGNTKQKGELLAKRAMIYAVSQDYRLQSKLNNIPKIPDGHGGEEQITNTPEYLQSLKESVEKAVETAKKSRGALTPTPKFKDVIDSTKQKLLGKQQQIKEQLKEQFRQNLDQEGERGRVRKELFGAGK